MHLCIYVFCHIFVMQSGTKNLLITRYTREKILDPRNTHGKKVGPTRYPRSHDGTIALDAQDPHLHVTHYPADIFLFKVNNRNTTTRSEICSKLTTKAPERRHWRGSGAFIINFEHISQVALVFLL